MIAKDKALKRICRNYHLVENYMQARFDEENKWQLHHRREIDEMKSMKQLKDEGMYYGVEPEELIFLTEAEHRIIHNINALPETRKKMSKSQSGENHPLYGKRHTEAAKKKMRENHADVNGKNNPMFGKKCWNNGIIQIISKERPGQDFVRGRLRIK